MDNKALEKKVSGELIDILESIQLRMIGVEVGKNMVIELFKDMEKTPSDINEECHGHYLELLEVGDFGKLYRCPLCGKSVLDGGNKVSWFLKLAMVLLFILSIFSLIILTYLLINPELFIKV